MHYTSENILMVHLQFIRDSKKSIRATIVEYSLSDIYIWSTFKSNAILVTLLATIDKIQRKNS